MHAYWTFGLGRTMQFSLLLYRDIYMDSLFSSSTMMIMMMGIDTGDKGWRSSGFAKLVWWFFSRPGQV
ncbi:hypothetical protein I7I50_06883 [Histoplasma capsulatum G186AR]|uniref:Uncharacterized protein n=1 Tax=Ajellomyces capsulatus TaxID=5037 RepID=A0A8H7Z1U0_AJECA|nr:hypothetical protein I7I52_10043 [Histoplasma capsulatum]QSS67719.1 hypothetical protein I7I50_06883 [Histoplasma capsulatum G186AR]